MDTLKVLRAHPGMVNFPTASMTISITVCLTTVISEGSQLRNLLFMVSEQLKKTSDNVNLLVINTVQDMVNKKILTCKIVINKLICKT